MFFSVYGSVPDDGEPLAFNAFYFIPVCEGWGYGGRLWEPAKSEKKVSKSTNESFKLTVTDQSLTWDMTKLLFLEVNLCEWKSSMRVETKPTFLDINLLLLAIKLEMDNMKKTIILLRD